MNFSHIPHPDEDLFHYGVKGMKWGTRRRRASSRRRVASSKKKHRGRKLLFGAAVVGGVAATGLILKKHGRPPAKELSREMSRNARTMQDGVAFRARDKNGKLITQIGLDVPLDHIRYT